VQTSSQQVQCGKRQRSPHHQEVLGFLFWFGAELGRYSQWVQASQYLIQAPSHVRVNLKMRRAFFVNSNAQRATIDCDPLASAFIHFTYQHIAGVVLGLVAAHELGNDTAQVIDQARF